MSQWRIGVLLTNIILGISEILFIISYLFADILLLRVVTVFGLFGYILGALVAGYESEGMLALLVFNILAIIINFVQIYRLIIQRIPVLLPHELKDLYSKVFFMMSPNDFYKIYHYGNVKFFNKGDELAQQGKPINELLLIKNGLVNVEKNNISVAEVDAGFFIGEISFLVNNPANATVQVISPTLESLCWDKKSLEKLQKSHPELYQKLKEAIAINLIKKLDQASTVEDDA